MFNATVDSSHVVLAILCGFPWTCHGCRSGSPQPSVPPPLDGLLTNVYRAFDVRDAHAVYDRLARSVTGDQLAQIYLQNRRSLELENRGGARAKVDAVDILSVHRVTRSKQGGFRADAVWTVSGSVTHFGHTYYRRNQYRAWVTFGRQGEVWKIRDIEMIDAQRVL